MERRRLPRRHQALHLDGQHGGYRQRGLPRLSHAQHQPLNPHATFLADSQDNFAWAIYGNATYAFSEAWRLDVSLRYDRDTRENTTETPPEFLPNVPGFPPATTGEVRKESFSDFQPKVTLGWRPQSNLNFYAGYSNGFRSGGFNQTGVGAIAAASGIVGVNDIFEAEEASTIEIGAKTSWLDNRLTLNAAAFTTKSENGYFFVFLAANSTQNLGNIPETRINGFEVDSVFKAAEGLDFNFGFGFTDSEIKDFPDPTAIGNEAPLISRTTLNLGGQYRTAISDALGLLTRLDYRRIGKTWWDVENSTVRDPVNLVDIRAGIEADRWSVTGYATNLLNAEYNAEFSPGGFVFKARPRVYGVEATYRF